MWHPGWSFVGEIRIVLNAYGLLRTLPTKPLQQPPPLFGVCTAAAEITHAVQEPTWEEEVASSWASWVCLPQDLIQFSLFPASHALLLSDGAISTGKDGMLGRFYPISFTKACASRTRRPRQFFLPAVPWGVGAHLCLGPVCWLDISPFSLNLLDVPFRQRSLLGEQGTLSHKPPWDPWSLINYLCWLWLISLQLVGNLVQLFQWPYLQSIYLSWFFIDVLLCFYRNSLWKLKSNNTYSPKDQPTHSFLLTKSGSQEFVMLALILTILLNYYYYQLLNHFNY